MNEILSEYVFELRAILCQYLVSVERTDRLHTLARVMLNSITPDVSVSTYILSAIFTMVQFDIYQLNQLEQGNFIMPPSKFAPQWRFAKVELSSDDRQAFQEWSLQFQEDVIEILANEILGLYKFSLVYNSEKQAWIATLSGQPGSKTNERTSLTAFHQTPHEAVLLLLYKHLIICKGGDWGKQTEPEDWG